MPRHAATPDWTRFRERIVAGTAQDAIPRACELASSWLDLAPDERHARVAASIASEAQARFMLQALPLVRIGLRRDGGDEEARRIDATVSIASLVTQRFPAAALPSPAADPFRDALVARTPALSAAIHAVDIAEVTQAKVEALAHAIEAFAATGAGASPDVAREFAWWLATAWCTMGRARLALGRIDDARAAFARAATSYEQAGDGRAVAACRRRLDEIDAHRAGDFDAAADRELRTVLERHDALGRATALARLAFEMGQAGDLFGAGATAERAARSLVQAGYLDPSRDFDAAAASLIATACRSATGNDLFARVCDVAALWSAVLGARASASLATDPPASEHAQRTLARMGELSNELFAQSGRASDEAAQRFAAWYPGEEAAFDRPDLTPALQRAQRLAELDAALMKLHAAAARRPSRRHAVDATRLRERAQALGSRVHVVRATLEEAQALLGLHREEEALAVADLALRSLLNGRSASLSAFTTRYERELYLTAIDCKARCLAANHDDEAILALCEPVTSDIERERARVSSPYQQSAFLATRAQIYEFVAAAAYRTGKLDTVLRVSELLKSRALAASRLAGTGDTEVDTQLREVNDALREAAPDEVHELAERREWLAAARAISRARSSSAELPQITIAAIQAALDVDTAAVTWLFVGDDALVVLAIRRDGSRPALVRIDPTVAGQLRDYRACVTALAHARPSYKRLVPRIDELVASLGAVLLPADVRNFIAGAAKLVLSPHRGLHLFPFHAASWTDEDATRFVIERFCVQYVPNLTSLLLPWHGKREGPVLAVGVGHFDDSRVPPLPGAVKEARAVAGAHGEEGRALIDPTREQLLSLPLADYRCLHFATHGSSVLGGGAVDDPLQACLFLRDGPLTAWDVSALALRAELAVLAACHSGQRAIAGRGLARLPGDDLFGLAGAFFEAGVACVLGTLWPVHDDTAKALVVAFHEAHARGRAPARALADALRAHLRDRKRARDVFFWAPFFVSALGSASPAGQSGSDGAIASHSSSVG